MLRQMVQQRRLFRRQIGETCGTVVWTCHGLVPVTVLI
jgi:hypothetical protein